MSVQASANSEQNPRFLSRKLLLAMTVIIAVPILIKVLFSPHYFGSDDSYIHLQIARNLLTSGLWGVNPGSRCNLSTAPLFTLSLAAALYFFKSSTVLVMQIASCIATSLGLIAIFLRLEVTTRRNHIASLLGLGTAAFACNLWRWNGTIMETTFAFCTVSWLLLLLADFNLTKVRAAEAGILLGLSVLLRPELFILLPVCCILIVRLAPPARRLSSLLSVALTGACPPAAWLLFSKVYFGTFLPTTFYAKTAGALIFWNIDIMRESVELIAFSLLFPTLLFLLCLLFLRGKLRHLPNHLALPVLACLGILTFYYLRAPGLEAPGRYLLPMFPLFAVSAGELLAVTMRQRSSVIPGRLGWSTAVVTVLVSHLLLSLYFNARLITPVLQAFQTGYYASMCNASEYIARTRPGSVALVYIDIGVVAYCSNGRFVIADGGGLASPELAHHSLQEQIVLAKPDLVLESQGDSSFDWKQDYPDLKPLWSSGYRGHGIASRAKLFVNIYAMKPGS
jgi:hypothetical protein